MKLKATRTKIGTSRNVIGLMSGTSADGVDAALVRISGSRDAVRVKPLAFSSLPYPRALQQRIVSAAADGSVAEICHLNAVLGEWDLPSDEAVSGARILTVRLEPASGDLP